MNKAKIMSKVLQCCQLSKSYKQGDIETKVLNNLELSVDKGELLAVVGSSGCGKSTFLHLAGALDTPSSGQVLLMILISTNYQIKNGLSLETSILALFINFTI